MLIVNRCQCLPNKEGGVCGRELQMLFKRIQAHRALKGSLLWLDPALPKGDLSVKSFVFRVNIEEKN